MPAAPSPRPLTRSPATETFVLIDGWDKRPARLYLTPVERVIARRADEVLAALARIETLAARGAHLAGYIAYEAGLTLEPRLGALAAPRVGADGPLVWFASFAEQAELSAAELVRWLAAGTGPGPHGLGPLVPMVSPGGHAGAMAALQARIAAGDIYQANLTLPLAGPWRGDPLALYAALRGGNAAGHGALVHDGAHWLLSMSPESFVAIAGGAVTTRPMKGTAPRGRDAAQDAALVAALAGSAKDRAENLMIVDLLRNDLARVAVPGSVRVADAFAIETYPSVHQMTSTVHATLGTCGAVDVIRALFPSGSVTGAPKIRAMELIDAAEPNPRGAYCGAIGWTGPGRHGQDDAGEAAFNVAIRTLRLSGDGSRTETGGRAVLGVGSAITAGSSPLSEWRECLVKGGFVNQPAAALTPDGPREAVGVADFDLIETMAFSPEDGVALLDRHLARLSASARALGFSYDRHGLRNAIHALCFAEEAPARLRLVLARSGAYSLEVSALPAPRGAPLACVVLPLPVDPGDWRLRHKSSDRWFYEAGLAAARHAGADEALFLRDDGLLTEGCFTSLFVERDGHLLTPPERLGLLPGVLRASLLAQGRAVEAELSLADLAAGFLIGNALRGLMPARLPE